MNRKALFIVVSIMFAVLLCGCQSETSTGPEPTTESKLTLETAEDIVNALKDAGLTITNMDVYTAENDPNSLLGRPNQYTSKVNFIDSRIEEEVSERIGVQNGGSVEMFNTIEDAETRFNYISEISKTAPMFNEYEYINGKVILRVSRLLTPEQAAEYENTLSELLK